MSVAATPDGRDQFRAEGAGHVDLFAEEGAQGDGGEGRLDAVDSAVPAPGGLHDVELGAGEPLATRGSLRIQGPPAAVQTQEAVERKLDVGLAAISVG